MASQEPCHSLKGLLTSALNAASLPTGKEDKQVTQEGALPHTSVFASDGFCGL